MTAFIVFAAYLGISVLFFRSSIRLWNTGENDEDEDGRGGPGKDPDVPPFSPSPGGVSIDKPKASDFTLTV